MNGDVYRSDGTQIVIRLWNEIQGDDTVRIFDAHTGAFMTGDKPRDPDSIYGLRYTPDGKYFIEAVIDDHLRVWHRKHTQLLEIISATPTSLAVSPDGKYFAAAGYRLVAVGGLK